LRHVGGISGVLRGFIGCIYIVVLCMDNA
jgi:hypothetical protein